MELHAPTTISSYTSRGLYSCVAKTNSSMGKNCIALQINYTVQQNKTNIIIFIPAGSVWHWTNNVCRNTELHCHTKTLHQRRKRTLLMSNKLNDTVSVYWVRWKRTTPSWLINAVQLILARGGNQSRTRPKLAKFADLDINGLLTKLITCCDMCAQ